MWSELVSNLTHYLDEKAEGTLKVDHCKKKHAKVIEKWDIPMDLKRALQWNWFNAPFESAVNGMRMYSVSEIVASDDQSACLEDGFVEIGSCANGDLVAVDFRAEKCPVVFVSHDRFWESDDGPRVCATRICGSLAELLLRVAERWFVPMDYYSGEEYRQLRVSMADPP